MKYFQLLAITVGVILTALVIAILVLWVTGGLTATFALYSIAILAALGVALRLWLVHREGAEAPR